MTDEDTTEGKIEDQAAPDPTPATPPAADQPDVPDVVDDDDPDAKELADAMAEVEAEEKAAKGEPADQPEPDKGATASAPATAPDGNPKADADPSKPPMIPKQRLDQMGDRLKRAEAEALYFRGLAEAAAKATSKPADAETPEPKPEDQIADLEAQIDAIWQKADGFEIAVSEARAQERDLQKQIDALKAPPPAKPDNGPREDLYLREKTEAIMQEHPYVSKIDALSDADERWDFIEGEAARQMAAEGMPLDKADPMSVLHFRQGIAKLTDTYGPLWAGPLDQTQSPTPTKPTTNGSTPSEMAQAREAKLNMADTMPPDISKVGSGGGGELQVTEAQIEAMSDEDIENLPESVRKRIAGDSF